MHYQYVPLVATVPASTPASSPLSFTWPIPQGRLKSLKVRVPAGHNGLTAWRIVYQGQQIFPWANNQFWTMDGETESAEWGDEIMAVGVALQAYNTDTVPHTFWCLAEVWPSVEPAPAGYNDSGPLPDITPPAFGQVAALGNFEYPAG